MIDEHTHEPCGEDWSIGEKTQHCMIQVDRPEWSHTRNALHVASSICAVSQGCLTPLSWPQSTLAIAIGLWRDYGESNLVTMCTEE